MSREQAENLEELLDQLTQASQDQERITIETVVHVVGERSFGSLLLVVGLILVSPLSGIPGMATIMAVLVMLISIQLLAGRRYVWLPFWLLKQSASRRRVLRTISYLRRPARVLDRWSRPRLTLFAQRTGSAVIALGCISLAVVMPAMELVPFSATTAGLALTLFGLSLFIQDGFLALISFVITALLISLLAYHFFC